MGRKNRRNRSGSFRPSHQAGQVAGQFTSQQKAGGPVVVGSQPEKPQADGDVFASIAALGDRIDQLKARWDATQSRIEQLHATSAQVLRDQGVTPVSTEADEDSTL